MFVPFTTDIRNYEDLYIHNPKRLLESRAILQQLKPEDLKQKTSNLDVNFLKNLEGQ